MMNLRTKKYLRDQAVKCRELAVMVDDQDARFNLLRLANEYETEASEMERQESAAETPVAWPSEAVAKQLAHSAAHGF